MTNKIKRVVNRYYYGNIVDLFEAHNGIIIIHDKEDVRRIKEDINSIWVDENVNFFILTTEDKKLLFTVTDITNLDEHVYYIHYPVNQHKFEAPLCG